MPQILTTCPKSKLPVATGVSISELEFEKLPKSKATSFSCPLCKETHSWSRENSYLAGRMQPKRT